MRVVMWCAVAFSSFILSFEKSFFPRFLGAHPTLVLLKFPGPPPTADRRLPLPATEEQRGRPLPRENRRHCEVRPSCKKAKGSHPPPKMSTGLGSHSLPKNEPGFGFAFPAQK